MGTFELWRPSAARKLGLNARALRNKENGLRKTLEQYGIYPFKTKPFVRVKFRGLSKRIALMTPEKQEELFKKVRLGKKELPLRFKALDFQDLDAAIRGIDHILDGYNAELRDLKEFVGNIRNLRANLSAFKSLKEISEEERSKALDEINSLIKEFDGKADFRKKLARNKLAKAADLVREGNIERVWMVLDAAENRAGKRITAINNKLKPKSTARLDLLKQFKKNVEDKKAALAKTLLNHLHYSLVKTMEFKRSVSKTAGFTNRIVEYYGKKLSGILKKTAVPKRQDDYYLKEIAAVKLLEHAEKLKERTEAKKLLETAALVEKAAKLLKAGSWIDARTALRAAYAKSKQVEQYGLLTDEHRRQLLENHDHLVYALSRRRNEPKIRNAIELVKNSRLLLQNKYYSSSRHNLEKAVENGI